MKGRLVILGAGESGIGAAMLGEKQGYTVFVSDAGAIKGEFKNELQKLGVEFEEKGHTKETILKADLVVKSPGIPDTAALIIELLKNNVPVISEIEFAFRFKDKDAKVVAITGTNGKTTTTLLAHHLLKTAGFNAALGGNVGISMAKLVAEGGYDYYVIEVSSFQLDGIDTFRPDIAVLLNITSDHLDRYDNTFSKYVASKFRITENLSNEECFIYCTDSQPVTEELARRKIEACLFAVSATNNQTNEAYLDNEHLIFNYTFNNKGRHHKIPLSDISLIGKHNMVNTMAAVLSVLWLDVSISAILAGLKTFENAPHRLERVATLGDVVFINDSKATNVDATYYALDGVSKPVIWIAGGVDKGNDYSQILPLVEDKVKHLICLGKDNQPLIDAFSDVTNISTTRSIEEAISIAMTHAAPKDSVLLSPACASFDLFKNYEDRGDQFRSAVLGYSKNQKLKA